VPQADRWSFHGAFDRTNTVLAARLDIPAESLTYHRRLPISAPSWPGRYADHQETIPTSGPMCLLDGWKGLQDR
jgi:hypothetical protein